MYRPLNQPKTFNRTSKPSQEVNSDANSLHQFWGDKMLDLQVDDSFSVSGESCRGIRYITSVSVAFRRPCFVTHQIPGI